MGRTDPEKAGTGRTEHKSWRNVYFQLIKELIPEDQFSIFVLGFHKGAEIGEEKEPTLRRGTFDPCLLYTSIR